MLSGHSDLTAASDQCQGWKYCTESSDELEMKPKTWQAVDMILLLFCMPTLLLGAIQASTLDDALELQPWMQDLRRELHQIPELGFQEFETSKFLREQLDKLGVKYDYPVAKTGIVGRVGTGKKPIVALRADMDGLPVKEEVDIPFKSKHDDRMHACGHDAHMAMLLGAARLLKERENEFAGTVLLVFQPGEEGYAGAKSVLDSGVLEGTAAIHALHVWATLESGYLAAKVGPMNAGATAFNMTVVGKGGHAAMPHLTVDPVVAGAAIVQNLQTLVSRVTDPVDSVVLSITRFNTGEGATNVIPDSIRLSGTLRALSEENLIQFIKKTEHVAEKVAQAHGCSLEKVEWMSPYYPPTINHPETTAVVEQLAKALVGDRRWGSVDAPSLGGEDFSFLSREFPGTYTRLGIRNESAGIVHAWHTSRFQVDESVFYIGASLHVDFALDFLQRSK